MLPPRVTVCADGETERAKRAWPVALAAHIAYAAPPKANGATSSMTRNGRTGARAA